MSEATDRLPPQALDMEAAVLGSMMLDPQAAGVALELLRPDDFYRSAHRLIFEAAQELAAADQPIDHGLLARKLEEKQTLGTIGGVTYLVQLVGELATSGHVESYVRIVKDASRLRRLISAGTAIVRDAYTPGARPDEVLASADAELLRVASDRPERGATAAELAGELEAGFQAVDDGARILTGFQAFDELLGGLRRELTIVAARPNVGKTTLALNLIRRLSTAGIPCAFFSLEMDHATIGKHLCRQVTAYDYFRRPPPQGADLEASLAAAAELRSWPFVIEDRGRELASIRARVRRHYTRGHCQVLVVDFLQKITPPRTGEERNRNEQVGEIAEVLKNLAVDLGIPVIALCQLNRQSERRDNRRPALSDLRDSGRIEEEADAVMLLHRQHMARAANQGGDDGGVELILAKGRNVATWERHAWLDRDTGVLYSDRYQRDLIVAARAPQEEACVD